MLAFGAGDFGSNPDGTAIHLLDSTNIVTGSRNFTS